MINEGTENEYIAWDVSSVGSVYAAFRDCSGLATLTLGDWNLSEAVKSENMFYAMGAESRSGVGNVIVARQELADLFVALGHSEYAKFVVDSSLVVEYAF